MQVGADESAPAPTQQRVELAFENVENMTAEERDHGENIFNALKKETITMVETMRAEGRDIYMSLTDLPMTVDNIIGVAKQVRDNSFSSAAVLALLGEIGHFGEPSQKNNVMEGILHPMGLPGVDFDSVGAICTINGARRSSQTSFPALPQNVGAGVVTVFERGSCVSMGQGSKHMAYASTEELCRRRMFGMAQPGKIQQQRLSVMTMETNLAVDLRRISRMPNAKWNPEDFPNIRFHHLISAGPSSKGVIILPRRGTLSFVGSKSGPMGYYALLYFVHAIMLHYVDLDHPMDMGAQKYMERELEHGRILCTTVDNKLKVVMVHTDDEASDSGESDDEDAPLRGVKRRAASIIDPAAPDAYVKMVKRDRARLIEKSNDDAVRAYDAGPSHADDRAPNEKSGDLDGLLAAAWLVLQTVCPTDRPTIELRCTVSTATIIYDKLCRRIMLEADGMRVKVPHMKTKTTLAKLTSVGTVNVPYVSMPSLEKKGTRKKNSGRVEQYMDRVRALGAHDRVVCLYAHYTGGALHQVTAAMDWEFEALSAAEVGTLMHKVRADLIYRIRHKGSLVARAFS